MTNGRHRRVAIAAICLLTTAGCADGDPQPSTPTVTPLPIPSTAPATAAGGTLQLYVSNQSFDDPTVAIQVTVDRVIVVERSFEVEGQHTWVPFPLVLPAGSRTIEARTNSGATLSVVVTVPPGGSHHAVISYWKGDGEPARLSWEESAEPIAFA